MYKIDGNVDEILYKFYKIILWTKCEIIYIMTLGKEETK